MYTTTVEFWDNFAEENSYIEKKFDDYAKAVKYVVKHMKTTLTKAGLNKNEINEFLKEFGHKSKIRLGQYVWFIHEGI